MFAARRANLAHSGENRMQEITVDLIRLTVSLMPLTLNSHPE
jgi:hypothetical protein